jgi:hypothetical protein
MTKRLFTGQQENATGNPLQVIVNGLCARMDPFDLSGIIRPDTRTIARIAAGIAFQTGIFPNLKQMERQTCQKT